MSTESASAHAGHGEADQGQKIELAERPREGETWRGMIQRQEKENSNREGYSRELMRSLPDEQQQEKDPRGRSGITAPHDRAQPQIMAEELPMSYQDVLREASQRAGPEKDRSPGMDR